MLRVDVFGYDEQAGCVFVDAMYEPQAWVVGVVTGQIAEVEGQGVDECPGVIAETGMHDKACWFVDDQQVWVFVNDV